MIIPIMILASVAVTRRLTKRFSARFAREWQAVEKLASEQLCTAEFSDEDPDVVLADHTEDRHALAERGLRAGILSAEDSARVRRYRPRRFVAALVTVARSKFGAPRGKVLSDPVVREATYLTVRQYLQKYCEERNVRKKDISLYLDDAVSLYFVPTRGDIRRERVMTSGTTQTRFERYEQAKSRKLNKLGRFVLLMLGHKVDAWTPNHAEAMDPAA